MRPLEESSAELELLSGDGLIVGLSRYGSASAGVETDEGDDWVKFHFQLGGSTCYGVRDGAETPFESAVGAFCFHGKGIPKTIELDAKPGFALTAMCRPQTLIDRFGIDPVDMPRPIQRFLDNGDSSWLLEVGKLTPEMTVGLRALETMPFEGLMRANYIEARAIEMLCEMWRIVAPSPIRSHSSVDERTLAKVERTRDHIDGHFAEPLVLERLARHAGTNEGKLSLAFRTVFGMTIFEYIRSRRMEEARRLLRIGALSVTEIAFDVGYGHSCNFSVAYKRHYGVSPKEERARLTGWDRQAS
jgi:AraC-like DNA-binding protein